MKKLFLTTFTILSAVLLLPAASSMPLHFFKNSHASSDTIRNISSLPVDYSDSITLAETDFSNTHGKMIDSLNVPLQNTEADDGNSPQPKDENIKLKDFRVYPNPTSGFINVFLPGRELLEYELRIINPSGKEVIHKKNIYSSFPFRFNTLNLEKGIYLVHIIYEDRFLTRKIIVN